LVNHECSGTVAPLGVDSHLKRDAVTGTDRVCGIQQQWIFDILFAEADFFEQPRGGPRFVRIDCENLHILPRAKLVAQLRELTVTDRSCVTVNEYQHDAFLTAKAA